MKVVCDLRIIFLSLLFVVNTETRQLNLFNWSDYLPESVIEEFSDETGIDVQVSSYESNEAMYTKLKILNSGGYDLAFPSTYFVSRMIKEQMLQKLDLKKLPNSKFINQRLQSLAHDPKNEYSIPYLFGFTILAYNSKVHNEPKSWQYFWSLRKGRPLLLLDDMRESFAVALKSLGYSSNTTKPKEINLAYEQLKKLKPRVRLFTSETPKSSFVDEEVSLGMIYNGDLYSVQKANPNVKFSYPSEGFTLWLDSMVIPRKAENVSEAHQFIDFICSPKVAAKISESLGYSSPNVGALKYIPQKLRDSPLLNPSEEFIKKGELLMDIGRSSFIYEDLWQRLKVIR